MERRSTTTVLPSIAIFISGYTPLFLIMVIKDIKGLLWYTKVLASPVMGVTNLNLPYFIEFENPKTVLAIFAVSILSLCMLSYVLKNISRNPFDIIITNAKSRSSEVVNYTIPYMISFVAFDLSKWQDLISLIIFLSILCLLSIRSQSIFINPILAALGYGLYDCRYREGNKDKECIFLSKNDLAAGSSAQYTKINNYMGVIAE
ncbi:MAG: hypothetical protein JKY93_02510 [Gammaproteobacteria bacterium]|nr:hypothetical protein [Gammaproteobacteria bacterium]